MPKRSKKSLFWQASSMIFTHIHNIYMNVKLFTVQCFIGIPTFRSMTRGCYTSICNSICLLMFSKKHTTPSPAHGFRLWIQLVKQFHVLTSFCQDAQLGHMESKNIHGLVSVKLNKCFPCFFFPITYGDSLQVVK